MPSKNTGCAFRESLSDYLDGELDHSDGDELGKHLTVCGECARALNELKAVDRALDSLFCEDEETSAPSGFAEAVIARAESGVKGLRCAAERKTCLFVIGILSLVILAGWRSEAESAFGYITAFLHQFWAFVEVVFGLASSIAAGIAVIIRTTAGQLSPGISPIWILGALFLFLSACMVARTRIKLKRA